MVDSTSSAAGRGGKGVVLGIATTIAISVVLFFADIHSNPAYYVDEATNASLGRAKLESLLSRAPMRIGPARYADYPRMSGYTLLVGLIGKATRNPGFASRYLSGICGVAFAVLVLLVARKQLASRLAVAVVVGTFLTSNVALIEFRYGFNGALVAVSLMATYGFSLLLLSGEGATFRKRVLWTLGASLASCLTLMNELFSGATASLLFVAMMAVHGLGARRRDRRELLLIAIPILFLLVATALLFSNPLFGEEIKRMLGPRNPVGQLTLKGFYGSLMGAFSGNRLLRCEWVFLSVAMISVVCAIVSLARSKRVLQLLAFGELLGPFVLVTSVIGDVHFYIRAISMYFPVFFASVILVVGSAEKTDLWQKFRHSRGALAACICLGAALMVGAADRIQGTQAYFAQPQKYFNDIPFDASFEQVSAQVTALVPKDQLVLAPPHLLPFLDHPYTTEYFLSQLCAGRRHPIFAPNADVLQRLLYPCRLADVHVAVLHPVFYEFDAQIWEDGPAVLKNIVTTWTLIGSAGAFAIYKNPTPSSPSVSPINYGQIGATPTGVQ